ncbi:zinc-dependent metalloprotease [Myxococcus sp. K38C18041901]|uniref:zinc-dependent metalloprotease n=1 Tax=Myxococcus guangdongensis TaxID=2906760 RepID=UPI0020A736A6|nr:zinc-dependent metalloprotease [Myxococcus guangdongensis]MCP3062836.1 zinc-dependent metalloprotease [Myxococcus guangdongensis]
MSPGSLPKRRRWWSALCLAVSLGTGCGEPASRPSTEAELHVELGAPLLAIPREVDDARRQELVQRLSSAVDPTRGSFYLAIHRAELGAKWFLSAYSKQRHPGGVIGGAGASLGTRVVSFEVQNDKLFVFDVDRRKVMSDVFSPEVLVEAYPIIKNHGPFNRLPGSSQYVLIDPTAGLNRFGVVGENRGASGAHFQVELSFAQHFRRIADGITFEQVYTGYADLPDDLAGDYLEPNVFRASGTLGIALRRYSEGMGYVPTPMPSRQYYLSGEPRLIPNTTGATEVVARKWNIHPGMTPIRWHISPTVLALQQDPRFQDVDLVGAVKAGIEGWNSVFGFTALEAVVADDSVSFADDDRNVFIFDTDEVMPFVFADSRINPDTGEIRGASIYFAASMVLFAQSVFTDDEAALPPPVARPTLQMTWSGMRSEPLCHLDAASRPLEASGDARLVGLTQQEKVERFLTHNVLHEIGHTLGLRHNFAGSLAQDGSPGAPVTHSVMEYVDTEDSVHAVDPGPYDIQAIRYLYGLSSQLPTAAFCQATETSTDPYCNMYDRFDDPLTKWYGPRLQDGQVFMLNSTSPFERLTSYFNGRTNSVLQFVRAAAPNAQVTAYNLAMQKVRPPLVIPAGARADYPARADELARRVLSRLYLDPATSRGSFTATPPTTPALMALVHADLRAILLDTDGARGYAARRTMVDILAALQSPAAHAILDEAQTLLTASLPTLPPEERLQTKDLLARISEALSPYYR